MAGTELRFPEGFLWGCASAAHQVEGGNHNDWSDLESVPGAIKDGSSAAVACDHYRRFREDLRDLADLGQNAHRFSVEWSRIEPEPGRFDAEALDHYVQVARRCTELGMEPLDCIRSATTVAADTIGMKGVGRLEPGSWGDVIGVAGNPVEDLQLLAKPENIRLVVKGGDVVKS